MRQTQLLDSSQTLEVGVRYAIEEDLVVYTDEPINGVVDDFLLVQWQLL